MTDEEIALAGPKIPEYFEDVKRQDETAARVGLGAFQMLEQGNVEGAKSRLLMVVGSYFRIYHDKGGDTNFMGKIQDAARKYPAIAKEISRKIE